MSGKWSEGLSTGADLGRINTDPSPTHEATIVCPKMTVNYQPREDPTMSEYLCKLRLLIKGSCAHNCEAIAHLKGKKDGR